MTTSIVVLSGGQDSVTTLAIARDDSNVAGLIHFDYGQRHGIERDMAAWWSEHTGIPLAIIPINSLSHVGDSALIGHGDIAAAHPTLAHLPASFVPGRNIVMLTLAAAYAMRIGATDIYTGVCETDYSGYPDCRNDTIQRLADTLRAGLDFPELRIVTPLMWASKADTWALAAQHGVLHDVIHHTHTCYEGDHNTLHVWGYGCGTCPACTIRQRGWNEYHQRTP